eukprot:TRINITY_DN12266_c0_g1_i3.p1 TRINITY_DN12266_c0_g1~~TRINITY_DN12266_c0_g1_i3.p1  ORF type:complete len:212 (-),score=36.25 TRINITY_DN12266_c0_g1_i3:242-877(-)
MQFAYTFAGMAYQLAYSYERNVKVSDPNRLIDAEQKIALAMLGFSLGKYIFSFAFDKLLTPFQYRRKVVIVSGVCVVALMVQTLVASLSYHTHNSGGFIAAFLLGAQSAAVSGKFEFQSINEITEKTEENLDTAMLGKTAGAFLIFLLAIFLRHGFPIDLLTFLILTLIISVVSTFMTIKKKDAPIEEALINSTASPDVKINAGDSCKRLH